MPWTIELAGRDSYGNFTPKVSAAAGQAFDMVDTGKGAALELSSTPSKPKHSVELRNGLVKGGINAHAYKDGRLLSTKTNLAPGQSALFGFRPQLHIGLVKEIDQGSVLSPDLLAQIDTVLDFGAIKSADIVMTGGGTAPDAKPIAFHLENTT